MHKPETPMYNPNYNAPYPTQPPYPPPPQGYPMQPGYGVAPMPQPTGYPPNPVPGYYAAGPYPNSGPQPNVGFGGPNYAATYPVAAAAQPNEPAPTNFGGSFSDKNIRRLFVRKVYLILLVQLLCTFGIVALFCFQKDVKSFVRASPGIYYASYATFLVTYITLVCCPGVRRRYPGNVICLVIFTLALSYMTGTISSMYSTNVVLYAAGMCCGVCLGISLLSMSKKFDITGCGGFLCVASLVIFMFGIVCIFTYNYIMTTVYAALFALLMMLFLAYDTQMILGGRRHELSPEEYILGALSLYIDVVYIFIIFLGLFGRSE